MPYINISWSTVLINEWMYDPTRDTHYLTHLVGLPFEGMFWEAWNSYCCMNLVCVFAIQDSSI
jgi:hypothetical protein